MPESNTPLSDDSERLARRAFFREGFRNLLKPVADLVGKRLDHLHETLEASRRAAMIEPSSPFGRGSSSEPEASRLIRPPGALEEELFIGRCAHSGECVAACPVEAIRLLQSEDARLHGTPFIDPQVQACVVCDELACMQACPSGALQKLPRHLIDMGVAELRQDLCLRSDGDDCRICVEKCPIGLQAIQIAYQGASVEVKTDGCVGCGVCEMYCPTTPRAIAIKPG